MSIRTRLLLAASAVLLVFVGLCAAGLDRAFRDGAQDAQENRLHGVVYALLGHAEQDEHDRLVLNDAGLPEPRLAQPDSGLEAAVLDETGAVLWRSPSAVGPLPLVIGPDVGHWKFERLEGDGRFALSFGLRWIGANGVPQRYSVVVLEAPDAYEAQLARFRRTLWIWLGGAAVGLLATLLLVQHWGLLPLARLTRELRGIEAGAQPRIEKAYPRELTPLTEALNAMIVAERGQLQRYRNALGDLAHSLKTPLAVLRGVSDDAPLPAEARRQIDEQVAHMQEITDHQLARAATAGRRALAQPVALKALADKIAAALRKVHAERRLAFEIAVPADLLARADAGDLYEVVGNLLDNAGKWARSRVRLGAHRAGRALTIECDDDGPGFPADAERLLGRGMRADSQVPGQGLGLAAVAEILQAYEGDIALARSADLGGARVVLHIPGG